MRYLVACAGLWIAACSHAPASDDGEAAMASTAAASLHDSLLVLDSHLDTPASFHNPAYTFSARGDAGTDGSQVDLPRMNEGGLDGGFWVIYTPQGPLDPGAYQTARSAALLRQMAIREFAARYHGDVALAFSAEDAGRIAASGRKVVFQSMENAYPLGEDVSLLETFYIGGLRMVAPAHFRNSQFADSATDVRPAYGGLSPLGEELVREANRLGLILDGSHASDDAVRDMLAVSSTPIILSHSGPKAIYDHPRNLPDDLLKAIAADGGVIQVNALGAYLEALAPSPERAAALAALGTKYGANLAALSADDRAAYRLELAAIGKQYPAPRSTFGKFMEHLLYTLDLVGPDHVGIGADWDGGGGVDGMNDVASLPRITEQLLAAGYDAEGLQKIWGGNMLRLLRAAEAARTATVTSPDVIN